MDFPSACIEMRSINNRVEHKKEKAVDELRVILHKEATTYTNIFDYISFRSGKPPHEQCCIQQQEHEQKQPFLSPSRKSVSEGFRRKISEWLFKVVDHFGFDREVVSITLNYIDRVAAIKTQVRGKSIGRKEFQLIAVASLYLAVKLHGETGLPCRTLEINTFVELSRGTISLETLERKELEILYLLRWNVNPPTTTRIISTLLRLLPEWSTKANSALMPEQTNHNITTTATIHHHHPRQAYCTTSAAIYEMATYLTELTLCVSRISFHNKPSEIAYASILCAMDATDKKVPIPYEIRLEFMDNVMSFTDLTPQSVAPVRGFLENLITRHPNMFLAFTSLSDSVSLNTGGAKEENLSRKRGMEEDYRNTSPGCVMVQCFD